MKILFVRFGSIGNALVSVPAIRAVRQELPDARLALLCNPQTYDLWKECPWLDKVFIYDQNGANKAGPGYLKMIVQLRSQHFTHVVHFKRFLRSELIGFLTGAKTRIGFNPEKFSLLSHKIKYIENESIIEQGLKLVRKFGIHASDKRLEYWTPEPSSRVKDLLTRSGKPTVIIHPFARTQRNQRWRGFQELCASIKERLGASVLIIGSPDERALYEREWANHTKKFPSAFDLTIPELASLIKHANLFIGSDSGPLHIASAVGSTAIGIYSPDKNLKSHLRKWRPISDKFIAVIPDKSCDTCQQDPCPPEEMEKCIKRISVEDVLKRAEHLLCFEKDV
jgi:ADP-heptose:LPS heptosyltransferase